MAEEAKTGCRTRTVFWGTCNRCGETVGKAGLPAHLKRCRQRRRPSGGETVGERADQLIVEGRYAPACFLHLETLGSATLADLDDFPRDI